MPGEHPDWDTLTDVVSHPTAASYGGSGHTLPGETHA